MFISDVSNQLSANINVRLLRWSIYFGDSHITIQNSNNTILKDKEVAIADMLVFFSTKTNAGYKNFKDYKVSSSGNRIYIEFNFPDEEQIDLSKINEYNLRIENFLRILSLKQILRQRRYW